MFVFARLFSSHDYGVYPLGVGFASVVSVVLVSWFRASELCGLAFGLWLTQKGFRFDLAMPKSGRVAAAPGSMALASYGAMHVRCTHHG